ncbi:methyl-accepting chemotaxis protein [Massilia sp. 9096]|uniref:methyl-accepting chemotaxis protein n=1 Tax=Massilia sp. 9096 TaxID=1500894 RepID=UPI00056D2C9C|nr:methyl-accepting chemotaxis protein [Massilia sp. 9096]
MFSFENLKIRTKLSLGFGALVALMLVLATVSLWRMGAMSNAVERMEHVQIERLDPLYVAREALDQTGLAARNAFIFTDAAAAVHELDILDQQRSLYLAQLEQLAPRFAGNPQFEQMRADMLKMAHELDRPRKYRDAGDMNAYGQFLMNECSPLRRRIVDEIAVLVKAEQAESAGAVTLADTVFSQSIVEVALVTGFAFVLCMAIGWAITRSLLRQLGGEPAYAADIADRIAHGELAIDVDTRSGDESSLLYSIRSMRDKLAAIVGQVRSGTDSITHASSDIASGSEDLARRTEQQAGALEAVASAMEELTSTVRQNADNATQANLLAQTASEVSCEGGRVVEDVVRTMGSINDSSKKIVDIIAVIDGIAFQTNILALNAAVEAARAGEQGRGFAVVASEVRNLAQRSAAAAKEIKGLIVDSVDRVDTGARLVEQAGDTMRKVVESVGRVTGIMAEISSASLEQTAGIEQVNTSIGAMDGMTQQNTALVEEASAAAQEMQQQAAALAEVVGVFKLEAAAGRQRAAAPLQAGARPERLLARH